MANLGLSSIERYRLTRVARLQSFDHHQSRRRERTGAVGRTRVGAWVLVGVVTRVTGLIKSGFRVN